jgi:hypothetical protein
MNASTISKKIEAALNTLNTNDSHLFFAGVNERTICARLAMYLQTAFPDYSVDCEYNRNIAEDGFIKRLRSYDLLELLEKNVPPNDTNGVTVYPDIIVHQRNSTDNLLVIEVKKSTNKINPDIDRKKLKAYKIELGYKFARFIMFDVFNGSYEARQ